MKKIWFLWLVAILALHAVAAHAQGGTVQDGCVNSPENPTAVLAAVGSLGVAASMLRARWAGRNRKR